MLFPYLLLMLYFSPPAQDLPPYFIKLEQDRTLFANNEAAMLTLRLGNQTEGFIRGRKLPDFLDGLSVYQGDQQIPRNKKFTTKDLYKKMGNLGIGAHKDFRLNLRRYFPDIKKGGIFKIVYRDQFYHIEAKNISVLNIPMPEVDQRYLVKTSMGDFAIELEVDQAPAHARNFALLVATQYYNNMIWHRVERGYVIQTGDPIGDGSGGNGFPLMVERSPFLRHKKYAVGMARKRELDSADSQFYICLEDVKELDGNYTVFGKVVDGFSVVDAIGKVPTTGLNGKPPSKPLEDVTIYQIIAAPKS